MHNHRLSLRCSRAYGWKPHGFFDAAARASAAGENGGPSPPSTPSPRLAPLRDDHEDHGTTTRRAVWHNTRTGRLVTTPRMASAHSAPPYRLRRSNSMGMYQMMSKTRSRATAMSGSCSLAPTVRPSSAWTYSHTGSRREGARLVDATDPTRSASASASARARDRRPGEDTSAEASKAADSTVECSARGEVRTRGRGGIARGAARASLAPGRPSPDAAPATFTPSSGRSAPISRRELRSREGRRATIWRGGRRSVFTLLDDTKYRNSSADHQKTSRHHPH